MYNNSGPGSYGPPAGGWEYQTPNINQPPFANQPPSGDAGVAHVAPSQLGTPAAHYSTPGPSTYSPTTADIRTTRPGAPSTYPSTTLVRPTSIHPETHPTYASTLNTGIPFSLASGSSASLDLKDPKLVYQLCEFAHSYTAIMDRIHYGNGTDDDFAQLGHSIYQIAQPSEPSPTRSSCVILGKKIYHTVQQTFIDWFRSWKPRTTEDPSMLSQQVTGLQEYARQIPAPPEMSWKDEVVNKLACFPPFWGLFCRGGTVVWTDECVVPGEETERDRSHGKMKNVMRPPPPATLNGDGLLFGAASGGQAYYATSEQPQARHPSNAHTLRSIQSYPGASSVSTSVPSLASGVGDVVDRRPSTKTEYVFLLFQESARLLKKGHISDTEHARNFNNVMNLANDDDSLPSDTNAINIPPPPPPPPPLNPLPFAGPSTQNQNANEGGFDHEAQAQFQGHVQAQGLDEGNGYGAGFVDNEPEGSGHGGDDGNYPAYASTQ
ncbi:hypothetical protein LXA43DRAFT_1059141 [Ganoderma leucocontextum]|nr:hypothetical protein LXA43DRAFT_1059141 [Ganoderma leucocontextum]